MRHTRRWVDEEGEEAGANRQTASLAGLAVLLLLVIGALVVARVLQRNARVEDCMMMGRTNCAVIIEQGG